MTFNEMGINEWLLITGTVLGPILAVQAQKWLERSREAKNRREWVFLQLMATRQQRLSLDHVRALNSIDLTFYGSRRFGRLARASKYQDVLDSWQTYRTHLGNAPGPTPEDGELLAWNSRGDELFVNLLEKLAIATEFEFKREELKSGSYLPRWHGDTEAEQEQVRRLVLEVLRGERLLPLAVRDMPRDETALAQMMALQGRMVTAIEAMANHSVRTPPG